MAQQRERTGRTRLVLQSSKVQAAYDLLSTTLWTKDEDEARTLAEKLGATRIVLALACDQTSCDLRIRIWADDPGAVKDALEKSDDPFWSDFYHRLDEILVTPLADQPCILI